MKKIIALIVLSISTLFVFQSCDGDDTPIEEKKTLIKYCITTDTPDAEFLIYGNGLPAEGFRKKGAFEKEMYTTDFLHTWKLVVKIAKPPYILTCMSIINSKHQPMGIPMWW